MELSVISNEQIQKEGNNNDLVNWILISKNRKEHRKRVIQIFISCSDI